MKKEMRTENILVRMSPSEKKRLAALAALTGETQSDLLRTGAEELGFRLVAEGAVGRCLEELLSSGDGEVSYSDIGELLSRGGTPTT